MTLVSNAPEKSRAAAAMWRQLASPEQLRAALRETPIDFTLVDQLVPRLRLAAADPLLDALEASPLRAVRRKLLDLITQLGPEAATAVAARLPDERWFVVRNMLMLLADLGAQSVELGSSYARHADPRVRREAIRILLGVPSARERAVCAGLDDSDERVVRVALQAAAERCPHSAVAILQRRVTEGTLDAELVSQAIAVMASVRTTEVLEWLLERAVGMSGRASSAGRGWRRSLPPCWRRSTLLPCTGREDEEWGRARARARIERHRDPKYRDRRRGSRVSEPARFLSSFAQALSTMALYGEGHPAREKAIDGAFEHLEALQRARPVRAVLVSRRRGDLRRARAARAA